jgi:hypothetical protein
MGPAREGEFPRQVAQWKRNLGPLRRSSLALDCINTQTSAMHASKTANAPTMDSVTNKP